MTRTRSRHREHGHGAPAAAAGAGHHRELSSHRRRRRRRRASASTTTTTASARRDDALAHFIDADFLRGTDYRVPLTAKQLRHYELIFKLNDHSAEAAGAQAATADAAAPVGGEPGGEGGGGSGGGSGGRLRIAELSSYMESLGHGVPADELDEMMREAGVELSDADGGSIDLASFLEFIRRTLVADLPSSKLEHIKALFTSTAREGGGGGGGGGGGAGDGVGGAKAGAARSLGCNGAAAATPLPHTHTLAGAGGGTNMHPAGSGGGCPSTGGASTPMGTPHSGGSGVGSRAARLPLAPSLDGIVEVAAVSAAGGRDASPAADGAAAS